jgi:signal transduction histidine kinase
VQLVLPSEPVPVLGDEVRLAQVFTNLLNNAAKYTDPGGRVELSVTREASQAIAVVRDNGRGLDAAAQQRIFEMFYQVEQDRQRSDGGLGLGLSLVKSLVELHGGRVGVQSAGRAQGSVFTVRLPLAIAPAQAYPGAAATTSAQLERMLVVDDLRDAADGS